jgi:hypothetical protein
MPDESFFECESPRHTGEEVRAAFDAELARSAEEGRVFSPLAFLALLPESGIEEIHPGTYYAPHRRVDDGLGGWNSGAC